MLYMPGRCNGRVSRCYHIESGFTDLLCTITSLIQRALAYLDVLKIYLKIAKIRFFAKKNHVET